MAIENSIRNPIGRFEKVSGTLFVMAFAILVLPFVAGCSNECSECPDPAGTNAPPFPPDGVFSITGDEVVTICWNDKNETYVIAYGIYRSDEPDPVDGYEWIADVDWEDACEDGLCCFADTTVDNGDTWYYGVTSINDAGIESEYLSWELVHDTPRPEGFGLVLSDLGQNSTASGYDFSDFAVVDTNTADIYFGELDGVYYIFTTSEVDIQDYGYIELEAVDWAPGDGTGLKGWANSGRAEAILGHSYVIRIRNGPVTWNVAKIEVTDLDVILPDWTVTLKWAYQEVMNWPELAPGGGALQ
jgi:hypothetical protein